MIAKPSPRTAIVIDTNVWISGLIFGGKPKELLKLFIDGSIIVIISEEIMTELRRSIAHKFPLFLTHLSSLETLIREKALVVQLGSHNVTVSRDPNDNMVIETASIGNASYIVSGDKDLLVLRSYDTISIVSPSDYLETNK